MAWFTRASRLKILATILAVALTVGLGVNVPTQVQAQLNSGSLSSKLPDQWEFTPPPVPGPGSPESTSLGGTRSDDQCILANNQRLIPLVPASRKGNTVAEYPTFFWYMPQTSASALEFVLRDANQQELYSAKYTLAKSDDGFVRGSPGIMSLTLPTFSNLSPLAIGQEYYWGLALICNPSNRSSDIVEERWIRRVRPDQTLALRVQQATPQERVALYADARLWYDTLTTLAELRREYPNNNDLADAWDKLLKSAGLNMIAEQRGN